MSGIATQAGMMRGGAGGSPLLKGLLDWWEMPNFIGQHQGSTLEGSTGHTVTSGPWGADTAIYAQGTVHGDALNQTFRGSSPVDLSIPFTLASVLDPGSLSVEVGRDPASISCHCYFANNYVRLRNWNDSGAYPNPLGFSSVGAGFLSGVMTYDGADTVEFFVNGITRGTYTVPASTMGVLSVALAYLFRSGEGKKIATSVQAQRQWTQEDAELFHNGGSFVRYSDL